MKFFIETLGCKVNTYESAFIEESFINEGYILASSIHDADIVVINTCSVTNQADAKSRKLIRRTKKENSNCILVVCGCSTQNKQEEYCDFDIDILLGNKDKSKIVEYVNEFINNKTKIVKFYDLKDIPFEDMLLKHFNKTRGFIKIQDGCNNYCSYCVIPYVRGNIRSKDIETVYEEAKCLCQSGIKEIVLTGIHTGSYGIGTDHDLIDLIRKISLIPKLERIRISSIEITELNDKFMDELKNNPKICNHLHIPIQSGSNEILKRMNRKYTKEEFIHKISVIRSIRPNINITTDLIVGFPYETDELFLETIETLKNVGFSKIHTFPYSKRQGTAACLMPQVNDSTKTKRTEQIIELSNNLESLYYQKFVDQEVMVLVENNNQGFTDNYIKVHLNKDILENEIVKAKITKVDGLNVDGEII